MPSPTRVAVVGAGYIADFHLDVLRTTPGVELVAVCDPDQGRAKAAAQAHAVPHVTGDMGELPNLGVDLVHLCVPPDLHHALARRALELGLSVYLEKPLALTEADAADLETLALARGKVLAVNHNNVFHPAFRRLVERVRAGEVGRVTHVRVLLNMPIAQLDAGDFSHWMFRAERNIVFEQGVHPISQVHHLVGPLKDLHAVRVGERELLPGQRFHEKWVVGARAARGVSVELGFHFGADFPRSTFEVLGTDGTLEADLHHDQLCGERKTLWLDFWNSYRAGANRARDLRRDARRVLGNWMRFTLGLGPRRDAFYLGMRDSIQAFHASLHGGPEYPSGARAAREVTAWCDAVVGDLPGTPPPVPAFPDPGPARPGEVVVLGGNGFIGRRVVTRLLERGENVTCVVRRLHSLPTEIVEPALAGRLRLVRASLSDPEGLRRALQGARTCVHLATGGGDSWEAIQRVMVEGTRAVGRACVDAGLARLVYVSSVAALYNGPDGGRARITDDTPVDPRIDEREMYSRGKAYAERAVAEALAGSTCELQIARPGVVLGRGTPMQHTGLGLWVRDNHCVGWGLGDRPIAFVWVDDVAEGLVRMALHPGDELAGRTLNLCADVPLTPAEVVRELARDTGRDLHFHPRALWRSQLMEIGKWLVKKAGRRPGVTFPSYRDLKSRSLGVPYAADLARGVLGWEPLEEREAFLEHAVRVYGPRD